MLTDASERRELDGQVRRLQAIAAFDTGGVDVVHRATAAAATVSPRPLVSAFVAGFLGLVLAGIAIVVLTRTDTRVRDERDVERAAGRPVTALLRDPDGARDALLPVAASLRRPVVLLTPHEGAADVMLALARAIALTGRSAIAIDADSDGPSVDQLDDGLVPLAVADGSGSAWALAAGSIALPRMAALVEGARDRADVVLLAGPPAAVALPGLELEVLVVAQLDVTRADDLQRAMRALTAAGAAPVGLVATTAPPRGPLRTALARGTESNWRPATSEVPVG
jgi:hypothetical protein